MKIINPVPITDENVISVGLDRDYPPYSSVTTYGIGDVVQEISPSATVTINTYVSSSPNQINFTAHGLLEGDPVIFTTTGTLPDGNPTFPDLGKIVPGRAYFVRLYEPPRADAFQISDELRGEVKQIQGNQSGTHTCTVSTHKIYESLRVANLNNSPRLNLSGATPFWLDKGNTNQWKRFDGSVNSQSQDFQIYTELQITSPIDSLALFNISGSRLDVKLTDAVNGVIYQKTFSLISTANVYDFWTWFFSPNERLDSYLITDLPPSNDATLLVTISEDTPEKSCLCGAFVIGLSSYVGGTEYGASSGIQDYSIKIRDEFGNDTILERGFSSKGSFTIAIDNDQVDRFKRILSKLRATPVVYVGSESYAGATMIYGWPKDWSISLALPAVSYINIEIEGLA